MFRTAIKYYRQSLRLFAETGHIPLLVSVLISVARVFQAQGQISHAVEMLACVISHPKTYPSDVLFAEEMLAEVRPLLSPDDFAAAYEQGKSLDLDTVVAELLATPA